MSTSAPRANNLSGNAQRLLADCLVEIENATRYADADDSIQEFPLTHFARQDWNPRNGALQWTDLKYEFWQTSLMLMGYDSRDHILQISYPLNEIGWKEVPDGRGPETIWIQPLTEAAGLGLLHDKFRFAFVDRPVQAPRGLARNPRTDAGPSTTFSEEWNGDENGDFIDNETAGEEDLITGAENLMNTWQAKLSQRNIFIF
jgi:hypothetical protein